MVGGASAVLQRGMPVGGTEDTKGGMVGRFMHRGETAARSPVCSGRGGGPASPGNRLHAIEESQPQGDASTGPAHSRVLSCAVLQWPKWSYQSYF